MKERLVKAIVASIRAGKFDEKLAATLNNYSNDFQAIIEMFRNVTLFPPSKICDNELQLSVYFSYLQKVVQTFGPEEIKPWHGLILGALEHDEGALDLLTNSVISLCQLIMSRETAFAHVQAANLMGSSLSSSSHIGGGGLSSFFSSSSSSPASSSPASSSNPPSPHVLGNTTHPLSHSTGSIPAYSSPSPPHLPPTTTSSSTSAISPSSPTLPPLYSSNGDAELLSPEHPPSSSPTTSRATYSTPGILAVSSQLSPPTPSTSSTNSSISSSQTNSAGILAALASPTPTSSFRHKIFNLYFSKRTQTTERILVEYADSHTMPFFSILNVYLTKPEASVQVLQLLNLVAQRQGPRLHEVLETPIIRNVLSLLEVTNDPQAMSFGLYFLLALLPSICRVTNAMSTHLPAFFVVIFRATCWSASLPLSSSVSSNSSFPSAASSSFSAMPSVSVPSPTNPSSPASSSPSSDISSSPSEFTSTREKSPLSRSLSALGRAQSLPSSIQLTPRRGEKGEKGKTETLAPPPEINHALNLLLKYLFHMFPWHTFRYLQDQSAASTTFRTHIEPLMSSFPVSPLLSCREENELSAARWRDKDPHTIVTECLGLKCTCEEYPSSQLSQAIEKTTRLVVSSETPSPNTPQTTDTHIVELGKHIADLQSLLEQHLCIGEEYFPHDGQEIIPSNNVPTLVKQVLHLKNEVLFERYLRHKYLRQYTELNRDTMQLLSNRSQRISMNDGLHEYEAQIEKLQSALTQNRHSIEELREQNEKQTIFLGDKIHTLSDEASRLREEKKALQAKIAHLEQRTKDYSSELSLKGTSLLEKEVLLSELTSKVGQAEQYRKQLFLLREELLFWEDRYQKAFEYIQKITVMSDFIKHLTKTNADLNEQLAHMKEKQHSTLHRLNQSLQKLQEMEKQKEERLGGEKTQKHIIEYQRSLATEKIKAMEDKYNCIKTINLGLERRLQELEAELEKYSQLVNKMAQPPPLQPITPPTPRNSSISH